MVLFVVSEFCRLSYRVLAQANFVSDPVVIAIHNFTIVFCYSHILLFLLHSRGQQGP